jgi:hypothetical protein
VLFYPPLLPPSFRKCCFRFRNEVIVLLRVFEPIEYQDYTLFLQPQLIIPHVSNCLSCSVYHFLLTHPMQLQIFKDISNPNNLQHDPFLSLLCDSPFVANSPQTSKSSSKGRTPYLSVYITYLVWHTTGYSLNI